jgi:hypothetical protein
LDAAEFIKVLLYSVGASEADEDLHARWLRMGGEY